MGATKQWTSGDWTPNDEGQKERLLKLIGAEYGTADVAQADYFDWQFRDNPSGPAVMKIAFGANGELAGQYVVVPMRLSVSGRPVLGALSLLTLTDKAYRGQGIFTGLAMETYAECRKRGLRFVLGFPNPNSFPGFVGKLGFSHLGELPLLLKPLKPSALVGQKFGPLLGTLAKAADPFFARRPSLSPNISELTEFDASFDAFDALLARRFVVHQPRDKEFLTWRFLKNPRPYTTFAYREGRSLRGYVVLRNSDIAGFASGLIVDFLVDDGPDAALVGERLLKRALDFFAHHERHLAGALACAGTNELALLKRQGFLVCPQRLKPQPFPVIFCPTDPEGGFALPTQGLKGWSLTMGDYDAV